MKPEDGNSGISCDDLPIVCKARDGIFDEIKPGNGSIRFTSLNTTDEDEAIQRVKERVFFL